MGACAAAHRLPVQLPVKPHETLWAGPNNPDQQPASGGRPGEHVFLGPRFVGGCSCYQGVCSGQSVGAG